MHLRLSSTLTDHLKRKEKYIEYIRNESFGQRFQKPPFSLVFEEKERFQNASLLKLLTEVSVFISKNATKTMPFRTTTPHQRRCATFIQLVSAQLNIISMYTLQKNSLCVEQLKIQHPFQGDPPPRVFELLKIGSYKFTFSLDFHPTLASLNYFLLGHRRQSNARGLFGRKTSFDEDSITDQRSSRLLIPNNSRR